MFVPWYKYQQWCDKNTYTRISQPILSPSMRPAGNVSNFKTQAHAIKMLIPKIYQRKLFCEHY